MAGAAPPVVAIVGRPNVGKSTLLNSLVGSRVAIVEPTPGVTRDRVGVFTTLGEQTVEVVDTGGIGVVDAHGLEAHVERQIDAAVQRAHLVLFVFDAREGLLPADWQVATRLRRVADRVVVVANKVETDKVGWNVAEAEALGYGEPMAISAKERLGLDDLEARIAARLPEAGDAPTRLAEPDVRLAVVGRVNAGKSTFVNRLIRADRMIVSEIPGTTRDSVDVRFERDGRSFVVIDTAGIRKERAVQGSVDFYAQRRAERAMRRADVSALFLDATADVARLDRKIADYALRHHHPVVIVANKWDLAPEGVTTEAFIEYLEETIPFAFAPIVFASAKTGRNVDRVIEVALDLHVQATHRVSTAEVNRAVEEAQRLRRPRPRQGRIGRIYYGSQVDVAPPTFVLFVNERALFRPDYIRFLENRFRAAFPMREIPIRIVLRERERSPSKHGGRPRGGRAR